MRQNRSALRAAAALLAVTWLAAGTAEAKKPDDAGSASTGQQAKASREAGQAALERGDYDAAVTAYTEAITANPKAWHSYYARGMALLRKVQHAQEKEAKGKGKDKGKGKGGNPKELESALGDFNQALSLEPGNPEALQARGEAHLAAGRSAEAIADFDAVLKSKPDSAAALYQRGQAHFAAGHAAEARADYDKAVKLDASLKQRGYYDGAS